MSQTPQEPPDPQAVADLVARYVERFEQDGADSAEALLQAAPTLAAAARHQLTRLRAAGLLQPPSARAGQRTHIGPYTVLERLGAGGMGEVYLAEQREPVRRRVAVKIIKLGMTSRDVLARFDHERQALALMNHANIARVFDAGSTEDGLPYFAMEHVAGPPLTQYCDLRQLDARARVQLMLAVCDAVQHAHYKGVVHRDIKPSNILVMEQDGAPVPKVIDFGVAKAVGAALGGGSVHTVRGMVVGTPEYMSPEQAGRGDLDVDTRTDVYSLGIVLYELLTGSLPFPSQRLRAGGLEQMLSIIRDEPPPRPSTRISTTTEDGARLARARSTDLATLHQHLRGELDWIVLKAIEKDRNRRYQTPADLADDLRHFLADEPIEARPPSVVYRARKFIARHRAPVAMSLLTLLALVGGLITSLLFRARAEANASVAVVARDEAERARQTAEANFDSAVHAVDELLSRVGDESLVRIPQMELVRRDLLQRALRFYEQFAAQKSSDFGVRVRLALAHDRMGRLQQSLGDDKTAAELHRRAIALFDELAHEAPGPKLTAARAMAQQQLSQALREFGDVAQARQLLDEAIAAMRSLPEPSRTQRRDLGMLLLDRANLERTVDAARSEAMLSHAVQVVRDAIEPDDVSQRAHLCLHEQLLATAALVRGDSTEAERVFLRVIEDATELAARAPERFDVRQVGCAALDQLAILYHDTGRAELAEQTARQGIAGWSELAKSFPNIVETRSRQARAIANLAGMIEVAGGGKRSTEIDALRDEALALEEALVKAAPGNTTFRYRLARTQIMIGRREANGQGQHRRERGLALLENARRLGVELLAVDPNRPEFARLQIDALQVQAEWHAEHDDPQRAAEMLVNALAVGREMMRQHPNLLEAIDAQALSLHLHGDIELRQGRTEAALADADEALALLRPALARESRQPSRRQRALGALRLRLRALVQLARIEAAQQAFDGLRTFAQTPSEHYAVAQTAMTCAAAPELRAVVATYESAALEALRAARVAGFKDADRVDREAAFAPLRERAEFLAELQAMRAQ